MTTRYTLTLGVDTIGALADLAHAERGRLAKRWQKWSPATRASARGLRAIGADQRLAELEAEARKALEQHREAIAAQLTPKE